jgi:putative ABC transport system ATP-binding protein
MIKLDNLHLTLTTDAGDVNILRGIDFEAEPGERVSVVGPSGSGKTSMMMIAAGLERATSGTVTVAGSNLGSLDEDGLALFRRRHVGIVFQSFHLVRTMTALENVAVPLEFAGCTNAFDEAAQLLTSVGLAHRLTHYPGQLSGGEQQRVAMARAFAGTPKLLLADEPTGNLDGDTGGHVIELLFELSQKAGTTLLLITHDQAIASRCDRIVHLLNGKIDRTEAPEESSAHSVGE